MKKLNRKGLGVLYGVLLFSFSTYALLDTFVIPHPMQSVMASDVMAETAKSGSTTLADAKTVEGGPVLLKGGEISVGENEEVGMAMASNPRTAIGSLGNKHYVFVVSDGRTSESAGLSLYELATFMKELGVENAYNLDGGGSSTMVFKGEVINNPTTNGHSNNERSVSDIVYIGGGN